MTSYELTKLKFKEVEEIDYLDKLTILDRLLDNEEISWDAYLKLFETVRLGKL